MLVLYEMGAVSAFAGKAHCLIIAVCPIFIFSLFFFLNICVLVLSALCVCGHQRLCQLLGMSDVCMCENWCWLLGVRPGDEAPLAVQSAAELRYVPTVRSCKL